MLSSLKLPSIEQAVKEAGQTILTPLVSLDTPGKATVEVVILADPVRPTLTLFLFYDSSNNEIRFVPSTVYTAIILWRSLSPLPRCCVQDGHEICFVGDEAFQELSKMDPSADELITKVSVYVL